MGKNILILRVSLTLNSAGRHLTLETGDLRCNAPLCRTTMEEIMTRVQKKLGVMDLAELTVFCDFLRTMLRIRPEERWPPSLILEHHWLEVD